MKKLITFIVPTIGRYTLINTINSLKCQTLDSFNCIIILDNLEVKVENIEPYLDERFILLRTHQKLGVEIPSSQAGAVRNIGLNQKIYTEYIGFVDDDDILDSYYIQNLSEASYNEITSDTQCIVFKMRYGYSEQDWLPKDNRIFCSNIGIHFCIKTEFVNKHKLRFNNSVEEDYNFIDTVKLLGGKIQILNKLGYIPKPHIMYSL